MFCKVGRATPTTVKALNFPNRNYYVEHVAPNRRSSGCVRVMCIGSSNCESYSRRIGFRTRLTIVPFLAVFKTSSNLFNKMAR